MTQQHAPERAELGLPLQRSYEHAQWLAEAVVTEISETGLFHRRAEQGALVELHPPGQRRERSVQGPDGPREPGPSEGVKTVQRRHGYALPPLPQCHRFISSSPPPPL